VVPALLPLQGPGQPRRGGARSPSLPRGCSGARARPARSHWPRSPDTVWTMRWSERGPP